MERRGQEEQRGNRKPDHLCHLGLSFPHGIALDRRTTYDLNHMLPSPFHLLPTGQAQRIDVRDGDILFSEGQPTNGLYISIDAIVHLVRHGPGGEPITIYRSKAGQPFA